MATRGRGGRLPEHLAAAIAVLKAAGFDLVIVETPGIGQGDADIVPFVDRALYVMTPEFGAASQLEKIDMLDFADAVAINKFERRGAEDALRDVAPAARPQPRRVRRRAGRTCRCSAPAPPRSTTTASPRSTTTCATSSPTTGLPVGEGRLARAGRRRPRPAGTRCCRRAGCATSPRSPRPSAATTHETPAWPELARRRQHLRTARERRRRGRGAAALDEARARGCPPTAAALLDEWPRRVEDYSGDELVVTVRGRELHTPLTRETLSGNRIRRVALPRFADDGDLLRFLRDENLPGRFPFTAGVFPFKREGEDPARMFAGEGDAFRTNRRFHLLSEHARRSGCRRRSTPSPSTAATPTRARTSTARSAPPACRSRPSTTWRRCTPGSTCARPTTSVSMTINGPAPTILAMFLNTAIDQQVAAFAEREGREPDRRGAPS